MVPDWKRVPHVTNAETLPFPSSSSACREAAIRSSSQRAVHPTFASTSAVFDLAAVPVKGKVAVQSDNSVSIRGPLDVHLNVRLSFFVRYGQSLDCFLSTDADTTMSVALFHFNLPAPRVIHTRTQWSGNSSAYWFDNSRVVVNSNCGSLVPVCCGRGDRQIYRSNLGTTLLPVTAPLAVSSRGVVGNSELMLSGDQT